MAFTYDIDANRGKRISASARSVTGGNNVDVWVEVQEI